MPDIDGVGRGLMDAANRGVVDRQEVEAVVERWKAAEAALDEAASSPMLERDEKMRVALPEYNESTAEVTRPYLRAM